MNSFEVVVVRKRKIRQQFHVLIRDGGNHETLFTSENYVNLGHAREVGREFATLLHAEFKDET